VTLPLSPAPQPSYRLIPSRFPPIGLFDTVATAADMEAAMELAGWTNDRLVAERITRLPREEWVFGRANASIVMAAFLHASPTGARFSGPDLGAWYASAELATGAVEVGHHLRREATARHVPKLSRIYRAYSARFEGEHVDIRDGHGEMPELYLPDSYAASQAFGETRRKAGDPGIIYDSVRMKGGVNIAAYRPSRILDVAQADHFEITVEADARRIEVRKLAAP
jgi:hypothetical protein